MKVSLIQPNICFLALDHKHERSDKKIINNLIGHLDNGVLSRRERYGEVLGRIRSGMFRQPQSDIYIASPYDHPNSSRRYIGVMDFLDWFDMEHEAAHRVYLILEAKQSPDRYKGRQHVIYDSTPISERKITGVIVRANLIKEKTLASIRDIAHSSGLPVHDAKLL